VLPAGALIMQDLGTLLPDPANPGQFLGESAAFAINDQGVIVGDSDAGDPTQPEKAPSFFQIGGQPSGMIPAKGGALGVNNANVAVGFLGAPNTTAFRFSNAFGSTDLTTLVAASGIGNVIIRAAAINNGGKSP
jgi:hypothetical protein